MLINETKGRYGHCQIKRNQTYELRMGLLWRSFKKLRNCKWNWRQGFSICKLRLNLDKNST